MNEPEDSVETMTRAECAMDLRAIATLIWQFEMRRESEILRRSADLLENVDRELALYSKAMRGE